MSDNVVVFSVTGLLGHFACAMVFPHTSLYIIALGGDVRTIGLVNFLRPLAGLFMFPIAGHLADRTSRVKLNYPEQLPICRLCPDVCPDPKLAGGCPCGTAARCGSSGLSTPLSAYRRLTISRGPWPGHRNNEHDFECFFHLCVLPRWRRGRHARGQHRHPDALWRDDAAVPSFRLYTSTLPQRDDVSGRGFFLASSLPRVVREAYYGCLHC